MHNLNVAWNLYFERAIARYESNGLAEQVGRFFRLLDRSIGIARTCELNLEREASFDGRIRNFMFVGSEALCHDLELRLSLFVCSAESLIVCIV